MPDFDSNFVSAEYERERERSRARVRIKGTKKYKKHLRNLAEHSGWYPCGAYLYKPWKDKTRSSYYRREYRGRRSSYIKHMCNRKIRRCNFLLQRGAKNRFTEFWWEYI